MKPWELLGRATTPDGRRSDSDAPRRRVRHLRQRQESDVEPDARLGRGAGDVRLPSRAQPRRALRARRRSGHGLHAARSARRAAIRPQRWSSPSCIPAVVDWNRGRPGRAGRLPAEGSSRQRRSWRRRADAARQPRALRRGAPRRRQRSCRVHVVRPTQASTATKASRRRASPSRRAASSLSGPRGTIASSSSGFATADSPCRSSACAGACERAVRITRSFSATKRRRNTMVLTGNHVHITGVMV